MRDIYCGVDLGGTKVNIGFVTREGDVIRDVKIPTHPERGAKDTMERVNAAILSLLDEAGMKKEDLKGIGIGSPGPLDSVRGVILKSSNLAGWVNEPIVDMLKEEFSDIPVKLQNDGNAATLGEYLFGCGRDYKNFVYITVSTGVGGGAVIDGKLQQGANSNAFEVGHMIINMKGLKCNCGNEGCFEAYASGTGMAKIARAKLKEGQKSVLCDMCDVDEVSTRHIFEAAKSGDEFAGKLVEDEGYYMGIGLYNVIALYNPEMIAIGGGVSNGLDMFYDKMMETIGSMSLKGNTEICKIKKVKREDCGLIGAAALSFYL